MNISKQGYLQQRKKLSYEASSFLNREYLRDFYSSDEPILWNNHVVFAIDGSKTEVPNSDENRATFDESGNQHGKGEVRALVSCMFDVFNHFFLDLQIGSNKASESELAKQNINAVKVMLKDTPFYHSHQRILIIGTKHKNLNKNHGITAYKISENLVGF